MDFHVSVQPRSSKNAIVGWMDDCLKIKLTAPPVNGKANISCIKFLAKVFDVPQTEICLLSGETSKKKRIRIEHLKPCQFYDLLEAWLTQHKNK